MTVSLTLFSTCKPFVGDTAGFQSRALATWARLPSTEVILVGDEPGVAEAAASVGARVLPPVETNEFGTPRLDALFRAAEDAAEGENLCYVNADILLPTGLVTALGEIAERLPRFLAIGRRVNVAVDRVLAREEHADAALDELSDGGTVEPLHGGIDLFAYPRGFWRELPPYLVGRGRWDSGLVLAARRQRDPVVDLTPRVAAVHPAHDHESSIAVNGAARLRGEEMQYNRRLLGGAECIFSSINATHVLTDEGLAPQRLRHPLHMARRFATLPALYPSLRPLTPFVRWLSPALRGWQPGRPKTETSPWIEGERPSKP